MKGRKSLIPVSLDSGKSYKVISKGLRLQGTSVRINIYRWRKQDIYKLQ